MAEKKLSPMMAEYLETKKQYPDCILFYRIGDFYEMFYEDAKTASSVLDLVLTGKGTEIAEAGAARQRQFFEALYAGVTPEERELMRSVTRKIMDNVAAFECETAK